MMAAVQHERNTMSLHIKIYFLGDLVTFVDLYEDQRNVY